jgi:hypothetical protein
MFLTLLALTGMRAAAAQRPRIDLAHDAMSFCCEPVDGYHDLDLFQDSINNVIGNAAVSGATLRRLRALGVGDLDARLTTLRKGNVLRLDRGRYVLTFPVITGARRNALEAAIAPVARALAPAVTVLRDTLLRAIPAHEDMAFTLLWSRVIDQVWCRAWRREAHAGDCPPGVDWVLLPASPYLFGTNAWGNDFWITWSRRTRCALTPALNDARSAVLAAARGAAYGGAHRDELVRFGILDSSGRFQGFAFPADGPLDSLLDRLTGDYAALVVHRYDTPRLAATLGVSADQLWVILLHETAYAIFGELDRTGSLDIPPVLLGSDRLAECRRTVSFMLAR